MVATFWALMVLAAIWTSCSTTFKAIWKVCLARRGLRFIKQIQVQLLIKTKQLPGQQKS